MNPWHSYDNNKIDFPLVVLLPFYSLPLTMSFTLLVLFCGLLIGSCIAVNESDMIKEQIVPDVVDTAPNEVADITYPSGAKANMGEILTPTQGRVSKNCFC